MDVKKLRVFDNDGETYDRYTVVLPDKEKVGYELKEYNVCLGLSDDPTHPLGFSQFSTCTLGEDGKGTHMGKEISFDSLPDNVKSHALDRLSEY